ncbi:MAG: glycosyltransferase family 4 protein, partial [Bacteroidetes bacterium]|nr:glycosyltransferase family 4 protein [Bacteroidota bacterium]
MSDKKHILILASWYPNRYTPYNGDFVQRIAEETAKKYKVTVLHICNKNESGKSELVINKCANNMEERIYYLEKAPALLRYNFFLYSGDMLLKQIEQERGIVDFTHVQVIWKMGLLAYRFRRKFKIPYYITEHWTGYLDENYQLNNFKLRFLTKLIAQKAEKFITVSKHLGQEILRKGYIKHDAYTLPNIVKWVAPALPEPNHIFTFIHVSNLRDKQKNVSGIIKAFANTLTLNTEMKLVFIGSNKSDEFKALSQQLAIPERSLQFYPELTHNETLHMISNSDCLVSFSNYETFGITCAEALCMGVPVIYTVSGGPEEYIENNMGIRVEKGDIQNLYDAMFDISTGKITFNKG